ncbi:hypothetical protein H0H81_006806 [Sphagnurus paluster]|uniref:Uncharacterized protein n=1 Tax=Sphagnurus paluster TaxID=117069 RepID=A0A9P7KGW1_9AGAR|nr:hypothetical protein H0H81_006806 [Sphagnurus paluster]
MDYQHLPTASLTSRIASRSFARLINAKQPSIPLRHSKMSTSASSPAILASAVFLTRPLSLLGAIPATIFALQAFLVTALTPRAAFGQRLVFTPGALAPLPLQLACVAFGIRWSEWFQTLGGAAFDLIIEPTRVYVIKRSTGQVANVYVGEQPSAHVAVDVASAILASPISTVSTISSDSDSTEISRPSSRASDVSDSGFSFSSRSSGSSATSLSSTPSVAPVKPSFTQNKAPFTQPRPAFTRSRPAPVAASKPAPTKYLYQGGVSTVLTGGVMLGGASSSAAPRPAAPTVAAPAKYVVPARAQGVYVPPQRVQAQAQAASRASATASIVGSWRRAPAPTRTLA